MVVNADGNDPDSDCVDGVEDGDENKGLFDLILTRSLAESRNKKSWRYYNPLFGSKLTQNSVVNNTMEK
jgi:hypothetical protein